MNKGTALEPEARRRYEAKSGLRVLPKCIQSMKMPWLRASLDGMSDDGKHVVEIKCGERVYHATKHDGEPPRYYYGQLQHILAITNLNLIIQNPHPAMTTR
jgi:putative phage-type endonuclease